MKNYDVIVGNIGTLQCEDKEHAEATFTYYVELSIGGRGRAAGEDVTLCVDGEPIKEHTGYLHLYENDED